MKFLIVSLMLLTASSAMNVQFRDCGSALAKTITISVDPCDAQPCSLKQGSNYSIGITFTPDSASKNIEVFIYGIVAGVPVPFPFDQPNACMKSGLTCPLTSGQAAKYKATLPVLTSYPQIKLAVKWELKDTDANKDLVCAEIPIEVIGGDSNPRAKQINRHWFEY